MAVDDETSACQLHQTLTIASLYALNVVLLFSDPARFFLTVSLATCSLLLSVAIKHNYAKTTQFFVHKR